MKERGPSHTAVEEVSLDPFRFGNRFSQPLRRGVHEKLLEVCRMYKLFCVDVMPLKSSPHLVEPAGTPRVKKGLDVRRSVVSRRLCLGQRRQLREQRRILLKHATQLRSLPPSPPLPCHKHLAEQGVVPSTYLPTGAALGERRCPQMFCNVPPVTAGPVLVSVRRPLARGPPLRQPADHGDEAWRGHLAKGAE
eukprot:scaffold489_cov259-Pinguiococcus_pyrenoidosus.AAC.18